MDKIHIKYKLITLTYFICIFQTNAQSLPNQFEELFTDLNISFSTSQVTTYQDGNLFNQNLTYQIVNGQTYITSQDYTSFNDENKCIILDHAQKQINYITEVSNIKNSNDPFSQFVKIINTLDENGEINHSQNGIYDTFVISGLEQLGILSYTITINQETNFYHKIEMELFDDYPIISIIVDFKDVKKIDKLEYKISDFVNIENNKLIPNSAYSDYTIKSTGL